MSVLTQDARLISINDRGRQALGIPDDEPWRDADWLDFWANRSAAERAVEAARAGGTGDFIGQVQRREGRWRDVTVTAVRNCKGRPQWLLAVSHDISEIRTAEERQRALREELNHRVKNTLAMVMSLAFQTARTATTPEAFNTGFKDRLMVLSKAHDLLTRRSWTKVQVCDVLALALGDQLESDAVTVEGTSVEIAARAAVSLALALRELATNACRHGALSQPGGRLAVAWRQGPGPAEVEFDWIESSVRAVGEPEREGLGLRLLRSMVESDLGGRLLMNFRPSGLKAGLTFKAAGATAPFAEDEFAGWVI